MDLFDFLEEENKNNNLNIPLAQRMKPRTLDEVEGQEHILGKNKLLYRAIKADKLGSIILYGPPGTGKTDNSPSNISFFILFKGSSDAS